MKTETFKTNHRYLVKIWPSYRDVNEVEVIEIAKGHIKLRIFCSDGSTYINWKEIRDIKIVEDLGIEAHINANDNRYTMRAKDSHKFIFAEFN